MKKKINSIFHAFCGLLIVAMLSVSCDDYLDIQPYGKAIPKTTEEFQALLSEMLLEIEQANNSSIGAEYIFLSNNNVQEFEEYCDNLETNITEQPLGNFLRFYVGDLLSGSSNHYEYLYRVIRECNIILDNYEDGRSTRDGQDIVGTCYAIRGVAYYQLLRLFCAPVGQENQDLGVPLVTSFDMEARPNRSTVQETIAQSENDLKAALDSHIQNKAYLFSDDVINACLCRLYFWAGRWSEAKSLADSLLEKHPLLSGDEYKAMVSAETGLVGNMLIRCNRINASGLSFETTNSYIAARPFSTRFLKLFAEKDNDIRYGIWMKKGRKNNKVPISSIRSAELALISMECACHLGNNDEALRELNDFRDHRITNNVHYTMSTLPAVDNTELIKTDCEGNALTPLMQAILNERRKELYMENGDRFFELKRNGRPEFWVMKQGLKYTTYKYMYTFPISVKDIELNPDIKQNPGYTEIIYN